MIDVIYSLNKVKIKQIIRFLNSLRKKDVEAQVEFTLKVMKRAWVTSH